MDQKINPHFYIKRRFNIKRCYKKLPKEFLEIRVPTQDDGVTSSAGFLKGLITLHESAIVLQE